MSAAPNDSISPSRLLVGLLVFGLILVGWRVTIVNPSMQRNIEADLKAFHFIVAHAGQGRLE